MRARRVIALSAGMLLCLLASVSADFDPKKWGLWREIRIEPKIEQNAYVGIELDGPVFAGARPDLADLRVVDRAGNEVPAVLKSRKEEPDQEVREVEMLDRTLSADGRFSFTIDLGEGVFKHNRVILTTDSVNFSCRVQIETSSDNKAWAVARADGYIFSFERDTKASYLSVDYPVSTRRYLRVTIFNQQSSREKPVRITGADVTLNTDPEPEMVERPIASQQRQEDPKTKSTVITLDLGLQSIPSDAIDIVTSQTNFHRHVEIEGKQKIEDDPKLEPLTWSLIGTGEIYQVAINGYKNRNLRINYTEARLRYLRIRVFHYDDRPIKIDSVRVLSYPHRLVFRAEPGVSYRLFYGNSSANRPRYDLERMIDYVDLNLTAALGPQQGEAARPSPEETQPGQPAWLIGVLIASAAVLLWLIFRLAKKTVA